MGVSILPKPSSNPVSESFDSFTDPITFENLTDPWLHIGCSKDFNKSTVIEFVQKTRKCPWCQAEVKMEDFIPNRSLKSGIEEIQRRAVSQVSSVCSSSVLQSTQMDAPKCTTQPHTKSRQRDIHYLDTPKFIRTGEAYKEVEIRARKATPNDWSDSHESKKLCEIALQKFRNGLTDTLTPQELSVVKRIMEIREGGKIDRGAFGRLSMSERYRAVVNDLEQYTTKYAIPLSKNQTVVSSQAKDLASEKSRVEQEKGEFYRSLVRRIETSKVSAANIVYVRMSNEERKLCLGVHQKIKNYALGELSNEELSVIKFLIESKVRAGGFGILMFSSRYDSILRSLERYSIDPLRKKA